MLVLEYLVDLAFIAVQIYNIWTALEIIYKQFGYRRFSRTRIAVNVSVELKSASLRFVYKWHYEWRKCRHKQYAGYII